MTKRTVTAVVTAAREDVGGLHTRQAIPAKLRVELDPFLLLAHHGPQVYPPNNSGLPFGPHPHRGFETVTFIRAGSLAHHDTAGHESVIEAGGVQWMTAGSGLQHAELSPPAFLRDGGPIEILQLWVNLPSRLKMTAPYYLGIEASVIPKVVHGDATVALVTGTLDDVTGPVSSLTGVFAATIELEAGRSAELPAPEGRSVLFYVVDGALAIADVTVAAGQIVMMSDAGDTIEVTAREPATVLFAHADRTGEPIVANGPFVMNSDSEIQQAFRDYRNGLFDVSPMSIEIDPHRTNPA